MINQENVEKNEVYKTYNIDVQVNGKSKCNYILDVPYISKSLEEEYWTSQLSIIRDYTKIHFENKELVKTVCIAYKLVNFVVKDKGDKNLFVDEGTPYEDLESLLPIENILSEEATRINTSKRFIESANWIDEGNINLKKRAKWFVRKKKWGMWLKIPLHLWSILNVKAWNVRARAQKLKSATYQLINRVIISVSNFRLWKK